MKSEVLLMEIIDITERNNGWSPVKPNDAHYLDGVSQLTVDTKVNIVPSGYCLTKLG